MRFLVHVHVFYTSFIEEVARCVQNLQLVCGHKNISLWVTYTQDQDGVRERKCRIAFPHATFLPLPNAGYDVGPFFEVLSRVQLDEYDIVVKLHTKRDSPPIWINFRNLEGPKWRNSLLSFCSTRRAVERMVEAFSYHPDIGLIAGRDVIDIDGSAVNLNQSRIKEALLRLGLKASAPMRVWGTMFAVRTSILQKLDQHSIGDFLTVTDTNAHKDYGLANFYEELISVLTQASGYKISSARMPLCVEQLCYNMIRPVYGFLRLLIRMARWIVRLF